MARQQPRRPQLVRIPVLLGLVACQRHQPGLGLQRNRRLLARSGPVIECRKRAVGHRPFDAAFNGLMMHAKSLPHRKEREILTVNEQHSRAFHPTCRIASRACNGSQALNLFVGQRQLDRVPPSRHDATPRLLRPKRGIHEQITSSMSASFMESVV
jgi:hypothetical protein